MPLQGVRYVLLASDGLLEAWSAVGAAQYLTHLADDLGLSPQVGWRQGEPGALA